MSKCDAGIELARNQVCPRCGAGPEGPCWVGLRQDQDELEHLRLEVKRLTAALGDARAQEAGKPSIVPELLSENVSRQLEESDGVWLPCSGCHETVDGQSSDPIDQVFRCHRGGGCFECGGIGATWDTTDYSAMAEELFTASPVPPAAGSALDREKIAFQFYLFSYPNRWEWPADRNWKDFQNCRGSIKWKQCITRADAILALSRPAAGAGIAAPRAPEAADAGAVAWMVCWVSLNTSRSEVFKNKDTARIKARETGGGVFPLQHVPTAAGIAAPPKATLNVEQGNAGLWYVTGPTGLLVAGDTKENALSQVGQALLDMQIAAPPAGDDSMIAAMNTALGKADYEAERAGNLENDLDEARAEIARLQAAPPAASADAVGKALVDIGTLLKYARWTISAESPAYHPTMPSATAQAEVALALIATALTAPVAGDVAAETIERCAKVAIAMTEKWGDPLGNDYQQGAQDHGIRITHQIRALARDATMSSSASEKAIIERCEKIADDIKNRCLIDSENTNLTKIQRMASSAQAFTASEIAAGLRALTSTKGGTVSRQNGGTP